uniref:Proteasome subunit alpha type n=1 Tax=Thraustochytrium sp. LLF1b TaxID=1112570 RepID=A0A455ZBC5_9STRA|nr:TPA_exp: proteasome subunit alpha type-5 [Thraustochytrium sp. LLF1b]|mmetsp:Transcript_814/g.1204  ORF Transcript_814/g.1204 Transcript_814/m.1204 type:complete len:246 (-) Transcript_814:69-806(-)|eukprot:CAMPEP_0184508024 /NCGR_PEP_ID=MMETSP0198_2-20121128/544_1 /TAXON_ID=1112570 /ORGANISM="Thraustochytrium sp., Strain LLF1b" /LENGTH=245 /DNA_ID=CAMNT_0026897789 /DNA_START=86 /DNA_END=823 /DNA_ORIENTATION=-
MFATRSEYDRGINTFSPEGRLFQVEYALQAIKLGSTAIGVRTDHGVILAVEKRQTSPLVEADSVEKIMEIDHHIGAAMSGLVADARTLVDKARVEAQNHLFTYNEPMRSASVAQCLSDVAIGFGKGDDMPTRPFGVALLLAGCDENGPQLYKTDPKGTYSEWDALAIGSGSEGATNALQEEYNKNLSLDDGLTLALKVLKQVMEEKVDVSNVEVATVTMEDGYKLLDKERLQQTINTLNVSATTI